ncbi:hypothetical protein A1F94_013836 [Pyrenophora tritici-repentis]|nr:hypothetical protein A1F94_013836 [Pyrenophora tritici-repentis]
MVAPAWRCKQPQNRSLKPMASQAAGNGAASNKQPTPVAADHGRKWCNLAALEQPAVALPLSEHNSKALSPERGFIQHTLHSVPEWLSKPTPRPKLQRPPVRLPSGRQSLRRAPCRPSAEYKSEHSYPATSVNGPP